MPEIEHKWSVVESLVLIGISLVTLGAVVFIFQFAPLREMLAHLLLISMTIAGLSTGWKVYSVLADQQPRPSYGPRARNWGPLIAAIIIGLATTLFIRSMFTHQAVRALDAVIASDSDED